MQEVRYATANDKERIREIWGICFGDSKAFMNWFFENRFFPDFTSCFTENGVIMSVMQSYPLHLKLRGELLPASMLAGVSTLPECAGKGYMSKVFTHYMHGVRERGLSVVVHTPANIKTFLSKGHYPVTDTLHVNVESARHSALPYGIEHHSLIHNLAKIHVCYQHCIGHYSGPISRTIADIAYKFRDYASDGAQSITYTEGRQLQGYSVYYNMDDKLHAEEFFALDESAYMALFLALCHIANGKKLHIKLPPDTPHIFPGANYEVRPQGALGIADVSAVLRTIVRDKSFVFEITDPVVAKNNGVWDGTGNKTVKPPDLKISMGHFAQFISAYRALSDFIISGEIEVFNENAIRTLDERFKKYTCFITDEY